MLKQRVLTGAALTGVVAVILVFSQHIWLLKAVSVVLAVAAAWELCRAGGYLENKAFLLGTLAASVFFALCGSPRIAGPVLLVALAGAVCLMRQMKNMSRVPEWIILLAAAVSAYCFGLLPQIRMQNEGLFLLLVVILIPVITDIGAYCFGRTLGKHKLAPVISPKKTWEGSVGGTLCAVVILSLAVLLLVQTGDVQVNMRYWVHYLLIGSCISQIGDLTFSTVKRIAGIKDYGRILPGHGGILDRFDSLVFTVPFTVFMTQLFGPLLVCV